MQADGLRQVQVPGKQEKHEAKLKQKQIQVKEVKFRPGTDDGDYNVKLRNLIRFPTDGDKAKITLRFRGREMAQLDIGLALLKRVEADLIEVGTVEQFPKLEGRQMVAMMMAPRRNKAIICSSSARQVTCRVDFAKPCKRLRTKAWRCGSQSTVGFPAVTSRQI